MQSIELIRFKFVVLASLGYIRCPVAKLGVSGRLPFPPIMNPSSHPHREPSLPDSGRATGYIPTRYLELRYHPTYSTCASIKSTYIDIGHEEKYRSLVESVKAGGRR